MELYTLRKRVDTGEGGLSGAKAPPKRKVQSKGKVAKNSKSNDAATARMKVQDGEGSQNDENDVDDNEDDDGKYENGDGHDLGSLRLKRKRASPKFEKSQKAGLVGSDGDNGVMVKGEPDEEDGDVKLGASQTP